MIIKLYKVTTTQAQRMDECGVHFSSEPFGEQTSAYSGYDDGGADYVLPMGYSVGITPWGSTEIYDDLNTQVLIGGKEHPFIVGSGGTPLRLAKAHRQAAVSDYQLICEELGFASELNFVAITPGGKISFTSGKPQEIKSLLAAAMQAGYDADPKLKAAAAH
jgi:hypothetical protein